MLSITAHADNSSTASPNPTDTCAATTRTSHVGRQRCYEATTHGITRTGPDTAPASFSRRNRFAVCHERP